VRIVEELMEIWPNEVYDRLVVVVLFSCNDLENKLFKGYKENSMGF